MDCELVATVITASPLRGGHEASCITYMGGMSLQQGGNPNPSNLLTSLQLNTIRAKHGTKTEDYVRFRIRWQNVGMILLERLSVCPVCQISIMYVSITPVFPNMKS